MASEKAEVKPKSRLRKVGRFLLTGTVWTLALLFVAHLIWKYSGSNQWEVVGEKKGVKVWKLKAPGSELIQVKGTTRVRSSLSAVVALMQDDEMCKDIGCHGAMAINRIDAQLEHAAFRYSLPGPFRTREFVIRQHLFQHPKTKQVFLEYSAVPDAIPPDDCCFRVTHMKNTWIFTPVGDGHVDIQYEVNMSEGGFLPYPLLNKLRPQSVYFILRGMPKWLAKEKYRDVKYAFLDEGGGAPAVVSAQPGLTH